MNALSYFGFSKIAPQVHPKLMITHQLKLDAILEAYCTFSNAAMTKGLKVIITAV